MLCVVVCRARVWRQSATYTDRYLCLPVVIVLTVVFGVVVIAIVAGLAIGPYVLAPFAFFAKIRFQVRARVHALHSES